MSITDTESIEVVTDAAADPPSTGKCVTIIFNPVSGTSNPEQRKKLISDALASHGYTYQYIETSEKEGAKALAQKALSDGVDLLAVSGGDGTVMEVLSAVVGTHTPVAVLPAGTGNLLSINLGIPTTVPEAVDVALSGRPFALDLAKTDQNRYFAILGGMGLDARMIRDADRKAKKQLGVLAYFLAAIKNLPQQRTRVRIFLDDKPPLRRRVKSVMVANMGKITGGLDAVPTASPDDGMLDVALLKAETLRQWVNLLGHALLGRIQEAREIEIHQAKRVIIETKHAEAIQFDGEDEGRTQRLVVEVVPAAVRIMLPLDAPAVQGPLESMPVVTQKRLRPLLLAIGGFALGAVWLWRRRRR